MAWKFVNAHDTAAAEQRQATVVRIDRWWQVFRDRTQDLDDLFHQRKQWDLPAWMEEHLQGIHPDLMWEFGAAPEIHGHRLVITPEQQRHLRPLAETILERAPQLPSWVFHGYRQSEHLDMVLQTVEARTGTPLPATAVQAQIGDWNRINLVYHSADFAGPDDEAARHQAFVATESLLGEETLDKWVGAIEVDRPGRGVRTIPLDRLKGTVDALVEAVREQLPEQPCHALTEEPQWSAFQLKPREADDYPQKADLIAAISMLPDVFMAVHNGPPFYSSSFSRCGERFCYVKIDGSQDIEQMTFADREEMEVALDRVLKPARVGCVVGGGTGLRYSYIDLALTEVDAAAGLVRDALRAGRIPRRSWLLFNDCEWEDEWIGLWDETPPPCLLPR